jgi:hypothetical protein
MIYQLPNGKVLNISIETFLRMSDEELKNLSESNAGTHISNTNPFNISTGSNDQSAEIDPDMLNSLNEDIDFGDYEFDE